MLQTPFVTACVLLMQNPFPLKGLKIRYPFVGCRVVPNSMYSAYDVLRHNKSVINLQEKCGSRPFLGPPVMTQHRGHSLRRTKRAHEARKIMKTRT